MARAATEAVEVCRNKGGGQPRRQDPDCRGGASPSGKEAAPVIDQHAWLDPRNGIVYVKNIAQALEKADPANAADYRARAASYVRQLQASMPGPRPR